MSRLTRRVALKPKAAAGKTYAEFVAHITALAVDGARDWASQASWAADLAHITTAGAAAGDMYGTSFNASFRGVGTPSAISRVVQHGLPSEADFTQQTTNGWIVFVRTTTGSAPSGFASLSRNGYASLSSSSTTGPRACIELIRWNGFQAMKSNPSIGGAETEYTW